MHLKKQESSAFTLASAKDRLKTTFESYSMRTDTETKLQLDVESILELGKWDYAREVRLSNSERIDFVCERVGIECKVKGSFADVVAQLGRYAHCVELDSILVISSRGSHRELDGLVLNGKRVCVVIVTNL